MNNFKIEIDAKLENVSIVRVAITAFVSNLNVSVDELMDIKTAASEAVTNAIEHGYENNNGVVYVKTSIGDDDDIKIEVIDYGKGIENVELAMTPAYTSKPELEHAGMGFTIMESFMDQVIIDSYVDSHTTVTLVKKIKKKRSI